MCVHKHNNFAVVFCRMAETDFVSSKFAAAFAKHVMHRFIKLSKLRWMGFVPGFKLANLSKLHLCQF